MIDTRRAVADLKTIESIAMMTRVSSTNSVAQRIVAECVANDLSLPQAMIIAGEQYAGRGRNQRNWSSPAGKGIYATTLLTRSARDLALIPLEMANIVASFLRDRFAIDARVKWPNDVLANGRKIAGILIEARVQEDRAFLIIGTGVNVEPVTEESTSIHELAPDRFRGLEEATLAFIEHVDAQLARPLARDRVLGEWRSMTIHSPGDRITSVINDRRISGTWIGIDDEGRALIHDGSVTLAISAGELITDN
ncbi:MAG TPA: biotin--[acetyl-CoA-carboxylase] ligase [Thermoanaerobaculia bacterium]|jgi:BirA family biotin operon repressor/biotin-[acetyl-CoA-carboxylase] ligase|nr:biotin--[acetyl-CoA-carboxylase] ligase [Thermoanaerobaculia bacterium]